MDPPRRSDKPDVPPPVAPEAIIYLPSISPTQRERDFASSFGKALAARRRTRDPQVTIECNEEECEEMTKHTITYQQGEGKDVWPIVDIYWFDYHDTVKGSNEWVRNRFCQGVRLIFFSLVYFAVSLCDCTSRLCFCAKRSGLNAWQALIVMLLCISLFLAVLLYFATLFGTFITAAIDQLPRWLVLVFTGLAFADTLIPECLRTKIGEQVQLFTGMSVYLSPGFCRERLRESLYNQLKTSLGAINAMGPYEHVHFVSLSFGTLLAIDALFPFVFSSQEEDSAQEDPFDQVSHLVTVGCPFDVTRAYTSPCCLLKGFYCGRCRRHGNDLEWSNIFIKGDFMGSNFRLDMLVEDDEGAPKRPEIGINSDSDPSSRPDQNFPVMLDKSWKDICFGGLNLHSQYFGTGKTVVFRDIVDGIFQYPDSTSNQPESISNQHWICNWSQESA